MNPERRNQLALSAITWLVTVCGVLAALFIGFIRERPADQGLVVDEAILGLIFPAVAIVVGLIACFERPRSGVKRTVSFVDLLPVILSAVVLLGVVVAWFLGMR
mgnify:CR=1 FL=1